MLSKKWDSLTAETTTRRMNKFALYDQKLQLRLLQNYFSQTKLKSIKFIEITKQEFIFKGRRKLKQQLRPIRSVLRLIDINEKRCFEMKVTNHQKKGHERSLTIILNERVKASLLL